MALWKPDPKLDLVLERVVDVSRELVWAAWTKPEHMVHWFAPKPWTTTHCEIDLRPGGIISFTNALAGRQGLSQYWLRSRSRSARTAGLDRRAASRLPPLGKAVFTAIIALEKQGKGTRYIATAIHRDAAGRKQHEEMGFHEGWGQCLDQLVAYSKTM